MVYQVYRIFPKCFNAVGRFIRFSIFCLSSEKSFYDSFPANLIRGSLFTGGKRNRSKEGRLDGAPFVEIKWRYARNNNEYLVRFSILIHRMSPWTKFEDARGNCHWEELRGRALRGEKKKNYGAGWCAKIIAREREDSWLRRRESRKPGNTSSKILQRI